MGCAWCSRISTASSLNGASWRTLHGRYTFTGRGRMQYCAPWQLHYVSRPVLCYILWPITILIIRCQWQLIRYTSVLCNGFNISNKYTRTTTYPIAQFFLSSNREDQHMGAQFAGNLHIVNGSLRNSMPIVQADRPVHPQHSEHAQCRLCIWELATCNAMQCWLNVHFLR